MEMERQYISRNLKNLYLDPNNYRFVDNDNYKLVQADKLIDTAVQKRARHFIEGKNRLGINDLLDSFRANGFLNVDIIQLKDLGNNNYLVLEGNRRVTALKVLQEDYRNGLDIGKFDPALFKSVPSEVYTDDSADHLIVMGLKHISGNKKWPAINQAKLIYDYLQPHWDDGTYYDAETVLCESLGITRQKLRTSQRTYHLILQYKDSDYGDQFESDMYYTFAEIVKKPTIKSWIEWNDNNYYAEHEENIARLFAWLSETEEETEQEHDDLAEEKVAPPIINRYRDIQDLAKFIKNENALQIMEEEGSVAHGLFASGTIEEESLGKNIEKLKSSIRELSRLKKLMTPEEIEHLMDAKISLLDIIPKNYMIDMQTKENNVCFEKGNISHFSKIFINQYKLYNNFEIEKLNRINIFAGFNNSGKTTLLEAIYLLIKQNNSSALFELIKLRNKLSNLSALYVQANAPDAISINGVFNQTNVTLCIEKYEDTGIDQKDDYLSSYRIGSSIDGEKLNSVTHTFRINPLQRYSDKVEVLCRSVFKSPYICNKDEELKAHDENVVQKNISEVISFINKNIDKNISYIELSEKVGGIPRFLVNSTAFPEHSVDLAAYGEGLQRIWDIALAFAYCRNGVLLIDELETAIHSTLLIKFTRFIQELAEKFNVQVFITSHSKECIDAFILNDYKTEEISAYHLLSNKKESKAIYIEGKKLKEYIEKINFDLRGKDDE